MNELGFDEDITLECNRGTNRGFTGKPGHDTGYNGDVSLCYGTLDLVAQRHYTYTFNGGILGARALQSFMLNDNSR